MNLPMTIFVNNKYYDDIEGRAKAVYKTMYNRTNSSLKKMGLMFTQEIPKPVITNMQEVEGGVDVDITFSFAEDFSKEERDAFNTLIGLLNKREYNAN